MAVTVVRCTLSWFITTSSSSSSTQEEQQHKITHNLHDIIGRTAPCELTPAYLFISWQGVLTLAYRGLPAPLETLKQELQVAFPALPVENPGARWPKTTLGCLRDTARLTSVQFGQLKALCQDAQRQLIAVDAVGVNSLDMVVYECRSLERTLSMQPMALAGTAAERSVRAEAVAAVDHVIREWDNDDYWFHASKDGNREAHYRGSHMGVTLVSWVAEQANKRSANALLLGVLRSFRRQVDALLPGMYVWFDEAALHVTLRNIKD